MLPKQKIANPSEPKTPKSIYEMTKAYIWRGAEIDELLLAGWEPFAVNAETVFFRRYK